MLNSAVLFSSNNDQIAKFGLSDYSCYFPLNVNERIHYLDSSKGKKNFPETDRAIICVHGNPSWSWYYRHFFNATSDEKFKSLKKKIYAIDHLGMGFSSKGDQYISIQDHAKNLLSFIRYKQLKTVDLVVHDWGGILALLALKDSEIKIASIIGMNTSFFPRKNFPWRIYLTTRAPWNKFLNKELGVFSKAASYMTTHHKLSKEKKEAYLYPYNYRDQRQGIVNFLSDIPWFKNSKNYNALVECEEYIKQLTIPMMAIWGLRDFCFDESYLQHWKKINPQLVIHQYFDAGHWCLEDKTQEILNATKNFWENC